MPGLTDFCHYCWSQLALSPLRNVPVPILAGPLKGTRWSLAPCSGYWRGVVETDIQAAICASRLTTGGTAWDLGAHFGYFSFLLEQKVGFAGMVYCFEPDPFSYNKLALHITRNKKNNIRSFPLATREAAGPLPLIQHAGLSSVSHLPYPGEAVPADTILVNCIRLDDLITANEISAPDFIKIDIEGSGGKALLGARQAVTKKLPDILISFHSPDEISDTLSVLEPLGYSGCWQGEQITVPETGTTVFYQAKE